MGSVNMRWRSPAAIVGFALIALAAVGHSPLLVGHPTTIEVLRLTAELLGLAGTWFFGAALQRRASDGAAEPAPPTA
jgi:putative copper export protein